MVTKYLEKIHQEMYEQKLNLERVYQKNDILLRENIQFISTLEKSLDKNYESFSPRDINHESHAKIDSLKKEQYLIEEKGNQLKQKICDLNEHLAELESVLKVSKENEKYLENREIHMEEDEVFRRKILETQELERQRIARDLHDSIVQSLTNMIHKIEICTKLMEMDTVRCKLELQVLSKTVREIINDMRRVIYDLRPMSMDDIGLEVTLDRELSKLKTVGGMCVNYKVEGQIKMIPPIVSLTILRIVQEACNNILKHAHASNIDVFLRYYGNEIEAEISDDGTGFELENIKNRKKEDGSGFGISMMKERIYLLSGKLNIMSKPGEGTTIVVRVPIDEEKYNERENNKSKNNESKNNDCR